MAAPAVPWEQAEREANEYARLHGSFYAANPFSGNNAIKRLAGLGANSAVTPELAAIMNQYNADPFSAFMAVRHPGIDRHTNEFNASATLARFRMWRERHYKSTNRNRASADGTTFFDMYLGPLMVEEPGAFAYLTEPQPTLPGHGRRMTLDELDDVAYSLAFQLRNGGMDEEDTTAMRLVHTRLLDVIATMRYPRTPLATSRVGDVLAMHSGPAVAQHMASFVHRSFGTAPPQAPLRVRTHLGELQRIRDELAVGMGMTPEQLLARVKHTLDDIDKLTDSIQSKKKK